MAMMGVGCDSSGGDTATGSAASNPAAASAPGKDADAEQVFIPGGIAVAMCSDGRSSDSVAQLVTTSVAADTGRPATFHRVALPGGTVGLEHLCGDLLGSRYSQPMMRALLNRELTAIAGTAPGPGNQGAQATAYDLRTGASYTAADPDAFGSVARDSLVQFQPGTDILWSRTADGRITSRDVTAPPAAQVDQGAAPARAFVLHGNTAWLTPAVNGSPVPAAVNPSGTAAVASDTFSGSGVYLWRAGEDYQTRNLRIGGMFRAVPGSQTVPGDCRIRFWRDDTRFVCENQHGMLQVTLAASYDRVDAVQPLLPPNEGGNTEATLSADGTRMAFLAYRAGDWALFTLDLTHPGAVPVKLSDMPSFLGATPHIVAWE
ncbi:hypothetical protein [Streptodolium elevatio]|uniref:Uncharacterized protein n=1 Tax=Streptodolium elevatio TaxID=3157996 RepID=A0ABV3DGR6_9ACTN